MRRKRNAFRAAAWGGALVCVLLGVIPGAGYAAPDFTKDIRPILEEYCFGCHGPEKQKGEVDLSQFGSLEDAVAQYRLWKDVRELVEHKEMPPEKKPQPTEAHRTQLFAWIDHMLETASNPEKPDPGRPLLRRLNRAEYSNSLRDLLAITFDPAADFPADGGGGEGFDNNADTLFLSPILLEKYLAAAKTALAATDPKVIIHHKPGDGLGAGEAAKRNIVRFAWQAYRRPVSSYEVEKLMSLYRYADERGDTFEESVTFALRAVLVSPHFLFRVEGHQSSEEAYRVTDYELATRLSYFLWSSLPDPELFRLAGQQELHKPEVLRAQVERMLNDPKAEALAENFTGQWLEVRDLYTTAKPDEGRFPEFSRDLRDAMFAEPVAFFGGLVKENRSLVELISSDYTWLNETLARHYGIDGVKGKNFRRVALKDSRRGGVMGMAAVHTVTSFPLRTSPVKRGRWVLDTVLGMPPPPPPGDAGELPADDKQADGLTFRQRLEKHRSAPECASCHQKMDPIGFALENFDAIGRWRSEQGGEPVDATGELPDGTKLAGPLDLKTVILERKEQMARNLAEKMLGYALGRGLEPYDEPTLRDLVARLKANDFKTRELILGVAESFPFQYRRNPQ